MVFPERCEDITVVEQNPDFLREARPKRLVETAAGIQPYDIAEKAIKAFAFGRSAGTAKPAVGVFHCA